MEINEINDIHSKGFNCAQIVFAYGAEKFGMDKETACRTAALFGAGMGHGATCGAVSGALMAVGLKYGTSKPFDSETKLRMREMQRKFEKEFVNEYESLICKEILGFDMSSAEGKKKMLEPKSKKEMCPYIMKHACDILDEMLK